MQVITLLHQRACILHHPTSTPKKSGTCKPDHNPSSQNHKIQDFALLSQLSLPNPHIELKHVNNIGEGRGGGLPLLQSLLAGGTLSGGSGLARIVSRRLPHVGGGEGIILKSMSDFDLDGSVSFTAGTTGSGGGGREREGEEELEVAEVLMPLGIEVTDGEEDEEGRDWLDEGGGAEGPPDGGVADAICTGIFSVVRDN